jgi:hypothetical protein
MGNKTASFSSISFPFAGIAQNQVIRIYFSGEFSKTSFRILPLLRDQLCFLLKIHVPRRMLVVTSLCAKNPTWDGDQAYQIVEKNPYKKPPAQQAGMNTKFSDREALG